MKTAGTFALLLTILCLACSAGCGSDESAASPSGQAQLKVLGILYGKFLNTTRGQAPASEEVFLEYLDSKRPSWEKIVDSSQQMLVSPRDSKPMVILYGKSYSNRGSEAATWMAYEQEGVGGMRQAISIRGTTEEMDAERISSLFPE